MKPEDLARDALYGHSAFTGGTLQAFTEALRTYGESEYQMGLAEGMARAARIAEEYRVGSSAALRIRALAPKAEDPSSEYQRGRGDGLREAADGCIHYANTALEASIPDLGSATVAKILAKSILARAASAVLPEGES